MDDSEVPFSEVIGPMRKVAASGTLDAVDRNAELFRGDVVEAVRRMKQQPGRGIALGGVTLPAALAVNGLIDEFTFVIHPVIAGRGPRLLDGVDPRLELIEQRAFRSGASVQRYLPAA